MKKFIEQSFRRIKCLIARPYYCPKCGDWIDDDEDVCQTCGYPWTD